MTSELLLDDVRVPAEAALPGAVGLKTALACLTQARYGIAWGALGALEAVYQRGARVRARPDHLRPAHRGPSTGPGQARPDGLRSHAGACWWRGGWEGSRTTGSLRPTQVSLAKRDNVRAALAAARSAREILGAAGVSLEHHAIRHMLNLETVDTYEGTHDIHTLIVGREITGSGALD